MRKITTSEIQFISFLLESSNTQIEIPEMVLPMKDGGMGSLSFDLSGIQKRINQIVAGNFRDNDTILVDFELTTDNNGNLFELDMWKVDFSKLISFPELSKIEITYPIS